MKNKPHFCILLKFYEISLVSCRRFDLAVESKKYLCHPLVLEKSRKINPISVLNLNFMKLNYEPSAL